MGRDAECQARVIEVTPATGNTRRSSDSFFVQAPEVSWIVLAVL